MQKKLKASVAVIEQPGTLSIIDVWERTSVTHLLLNVTSLKVHKCGGEFLMFEWVSKPPPSTYLRQDQGDNKCVVLPN